MEEGEKARQKDEDRKKKSERDYFSEIRLLIIL